MKYDSYLNKNRMTELLSDFFKITAGKTALIGLFVCISCLIKLASNQDVYLPKTVVIIKNNGLVKIPFEDKNGNKNCYRLRYSVDIQYSPDIVKNIKVSKNVIETSKTNKIVLLEKTSYKYEGVFVFFMVVSGFIFIIFGFAYLEDK